MQLTTGLRLSSGAQQVNPPKAVRSTTLNDKKITAKRREEENSYVHYLVLRPPEKHLATIKLSRAMDETANSI
jgi:hypothetical protein